MIKSNLFITASLTVWVLGTAYGFWHFEGMYMRPVDRPAGAAIAVPDQLPTSPVSQLVSDSGVVSLTGPQPVTVLNFWNPRCPCARYAEPDVQHLIQQYQSSGVRFVTVISAGTTDDDIALAYRQWAQRKIDGTTPVADRGNALALKFGVWAAPAAVILDRQSHIAYVGAYNVARYCSNPDTAWGSKALAAIVQGKHPPRAKTLFFGCQLVAGE